MSLGLIIKCEQGLRLGVKGNMAGIIAQWPSIS